MCISVTLLENTAFIYSVHVVCAVISASTEIPHVWPATKQSVCMSAEADRAAIYPYSRVNSFHGKEVYNFVTTILVL
jgi:hypothetical protein